METLAGKLSHKTLNKITSHFGLTEITTDDGGPFMPLTAAAFGGAPAGSFRLWDGGDKLLKVAYTGITVEAIGLDSHMIFAFTKPESPLPTFTLDSVYTRLPPDNDPNFPDGGDMYAFHLDLVPGCDLGINEQYLRHCYAPLTDRLDQVLDADGVYPAQLSPLQRAIMSPWMLVQRTTAAAYEAEVFSAAEHYLEHWLSLVDNGIEQIEIAGDHGTARDAANREMIFNRDIDPVWKKIDMLLGEDVSNKMIDILRNQQVEAIA